MENQNNQPTYLGRSKFMILSDTIENGRLYAEKLIKISKHSFGLLTIILENDFNHIYCVGIKDRNFIGIINDILNNENNKDVEIQNGDYFIFEELYTSDDYNRPSSEYVSLPTKTGRLVKENDNWSIVLEEIPEEDRSIDDLDEATKFEDDIFESMRSSMDKIIHDDHTKQSFQKIFNNLIKIVYPDGVPEDKVDKVNEAVQEVTRGILDMITVPCVMVPHEAIVLYDDYNKKLISNNNRELAEILNNHMSQIQVLTMKFNDLEKSNIFKDIQNEINK